MSALPNADLMRALRDLEAAVASSAWGTVTGVLSMLKSTPVTFASLKDTRAGVQVAKLVKHERKDVADAASTTVSAWKEAVKQAAPALGAPSSQLRVSKASVPPPASVKPRPSSAAAPAAAPAPKAKPPKERGEQGGRVGGDGGPPKPAKKARGGVDGAGGLPGLLEQLAAPLPMMSVVDDTKWLYDDNEKCKLGRRRMSTPAAPPRVLPAPPAAGPVVYWMDRDARVCDNWALQTAQERAVRGGVGVVVVALVRRGATLRAVGFALRGLREAEADLARLGVGFFLLTPSASGGAGDGGAVAAFAAGVGAPWVVCDASPLREHVAGVAEVARLVPAAVGVEEVDTHNITPMWKACSHEAGSTTEFRRHALKKLAKALTELPEPVCHPTPHGVGAPPVSDAYSCPRSGDGAGMDWGAVVRGLQIDESVPQVAWATPGERGGAAVLRRFLANRLATFQERRGAGIAPFVHFGHVSAHRVALEVLRTEKKCVDQIALASVVATEHAPVDAFGEVFVVMRELAENFCCFNERYDAIEGAPQWARTTLDAHAKDPREHTYTQEQFERGLTADALFNAAAHQLERTGKMHYYIRMYWVKKILEWSPDAAAALGIANAINDRYALDAHDPSGYVGCMWGVAGLHDSGGQEKPVRGKVKGLTDEQCKKKFDVKGYLKSYV